MVKFQEEKSRKKFKEIIEKEAEDLAKILSKKYNLPYIDLSVTTIDLDALKILPEEEARTAQMAVFQKIGKKIQVAIISPNPQETKNAIEKLKEKDYKINLFMVSPKSLERAWKRYKEVQEYFEMTKGIIDISPERIERFMNQVSTIESLESVFGSIIESKKQRKISEIVEVIMALGIKIEASDIHIEPQSKKVDLRLRIDGVLHKIFSFNFNAYQLLLSRIKLIAGLKLNIKDKAQDGRFSIHIKNMEVEIRVSSIPGDFGESIVLRILNPKTISVSFEELGIEPNLFKILSKEIKKPNGMILTTGPTGSGKTTTLYAILRKIYSPEIKIITLEDPIEYHLGGIIQTQTNEKKDYTFANGLRSILRQDPDIIMIGEIRDLETAKIALNAALTGHLVLSTLHTNNAAGTIPRLIDLGANPNIIAPALNVSLAQRLVRKLCNKCKVKVEPTKEELEIINNILKSFPKNIETPNNKNIYLWKAPGSKCPACNNIGYKGRIGIFEAVLIEEKTERLILEKPNETEIKKIAEEQGILDMTQDGILKTIKGITSFEELQRVTELEP